MLLNMDKTMNRAFERRKDASRLGQWTWTRYQRKDGINTRVTVAYRQYQPFTLGMLTVYAERMVYLENADDDHSLPRAFIKDLQKDIKQCQEQGDKIILMLDANEDLRTGKMHWAFCALSLE